MKNIKFFVFITTLFFLSNCNETKPMTTDEFKAMIVSEVGKVSVDAEHKDVLIRLALAYTDCGKSEVWTKAHNLYGFREYSTGLVEVTSPYEGIATDMWGQHRSSGQINNMKSINLEIQIKSTEKSLESYYAKNADETLDNLLGTQGGSGSRPSYSGIFNRSCIEAAKNIYYFK